MGIDASHASWPWLKLTEYGKKVCNSLEPTPHDPSGYLGRLKAEISEIDPLILVYLEESLKTYNINALLSSTVTLGCAAEKALLLLIESFANSIQEEKKKNKFLKEIQRRTIKRQFDIFSKKLDGIKGVLPGDVQDDLNTDLLGIFQMIRNYRNDAGHPTGKTISREQVYANLQIFISYCKKVYQLIGYFENNPIV